MLRRASTAGVTIDRMTLRFTTDNRIPLQLNPDRATGPEFPFVPVESGRPADRSAAYRPNLDQLQPVESGKWRSLRLPEINRRNLQLNQINREIVRTEITSGRDKTTQRNYPSTQ